MEEDLGLVLDNLLLEYVGIAGIFFVAAIALFNFTDFGKQFSLISLLISLILLISAFVNYLYEKDRISDLGFAPSRIIDILAFILIPTILLVLWVIYQVWYTEPVTLGDIAKEIEKEVDTTNAQLIANLQELDEKILATNRELINVIKGLPVEESKAGSISKPIINVSNLNKESKKYSTLLRKAGKQPDIAQIASLATAGVIRK